MAEEEVIEIDLAELKKMKVTNISNFSYFPRKSYSFELAS